MAVRGSLVGALIAAGFMSAATVMPATAQGSCVQNPSCEQHFPDSSAVRIDPETLSGLPSNVLWEARNEIFARHGYRFQSDRAQSFFGSKSYYRPRTGNVDLNPIEKANVDLIRAFEDGRGNQFLSQELEETLTTSSFQADDTEILVGTDLNQTDLPNYANRNILIDYVEHTFASGEEIGQTPLASYVQNRTEYDLKCNERALFECGVYEESPFRRMKTNAVSRNVLSRIFPSESLDEVGLHSFLAIMILDYTNIPLSMSRNDGRRTVDYGQGGRMYITNSIAQHLNDDEGNTVHRWSPDSQKFFRSTIDAITLRDIEKCREVDYYSSSFKNNATTLRTICEENAMAAERGVSRFNVNDSARKEFDQTIIRIRRSTRSLPDRMADRFDTELSSLETRMSSALDEADDAMVQQTALDVAALDERIEGEEQAYAKDQKLRGSVSTQIAAYEERIDKALADLPDGLSALGDLARQRADGAREAIKEGNFERADELLASGDPVVASLEEFAAEARAKAEAAEAEIAEAVGRLENARTELLALVTPDQDPEVLVLATQAAAAADRALIGEPEPSALLQATLSAEEALQGLAEQGRRKDLITSVIDAAAERSSRSVLDLMPDGQPERTLIAQLPADNAELRGFLEGLDGGAMEQTVQAFLQAKEEVEKGLVEAQRNIDTLQARVAGIRTSDLFDAYPVQHRSALEKVADQASGDVPEAKLANVASRLGSNVSHFEDWVETNGDRIRSERAIARFDELKEDRRTASIANACEAGLRQPMEVLLQSQRLDMSNEQYKQAKQTVDMSVAAGCSCIAGNIPDEYFESPSREYVEFVFNHLNADEGTRAFQAGFEGLNSGMVDVFTGNIGILMLDCGDQMEGQTNTSAN